MDNSIVPQAIIKWPHGLDYPPVIYPLADTEEETAKLIRLLEKSGFRIGKSNG